MCCLSFPHEASPYIQNLHRASLYASPYALRPAAAPEQPPHFLASYFSADFTHNYDYALHPTCTKQAVCNVITRTDQLVAEPRVHCAPTSRAEVCMRVAR